MKKEEYLAQRQALLDEAEAMIGEGKTEDANAKMKDIEELDNKWEETKLANANMEALKGKTTITDLATKSENVEGKVIESMGNEVVIDEKKQYENAWAKVMQGKKLDSGEQAIFDKVNTSFNNAYTHDTSNTAILIPETVVAGIWKRAEEGYPLLADVKKFNVKGTLTMKKHVAIAAGDAAWYGEDTATADEQNTLAKSANRMRTCEGDHSNLKLRRWLPRNLSLISSTNLAKSRSCIRCTISTGKGNPRRRQFQSSALELKQLC